MSSNKKNKNKNVNKNVNQNKNKNKNTSNKGVAHRDGVSCIKLTMPAVTARGLPPRL